MKSKSSVSSHISIPRCLIFVMGLAAGATLSLFFITNKYSSVQIQFQNILTRINSKESEIKSLETLFETDEVKDKNNLLPISDDLQESEKLRVLCMVMTFHPHHQTRTRAIKETWGRHCDILLFMSDIEDPSIPTINTNITGPNKGLWTMSTFAFKYVQQHYAGKFDWLYKCDDDTYAFVENMKKFLVNYSRKKHLFFGFKVKEPVLFMSGGSGYVIGPETLRYMLDEGMNGKYNACSKNFDQYEDVAMSECMTQLNVQFVDTRDRYGRERFFTESVMSHTYPYNDMKTAPFQWYIESSFYPAHFGLNCCAENPISFHHVHYKEMYMMEYMTYLMKQPPYPRILQPEWRSTSAKTKETPQKNHDYNI